MPITFAVDHDVALIRAFVVGDFSLDEMLACVTEAARKAGQPGYNVLSDHRLVGVPATRDQAEALTARLVSMRDYYAGARWAVVVGNAASFGMMRMLAVFAERVPIQLEIFTEMEPAEWWARTGVMPPPGE